MWLLQLSVGLPLAFIAFEDFKARKVYWFWFPILGLILGYIHLRSTITLEIFMYHILLNVLVITTILGVLSVVHRWVLKKPFIDHGLGLGDILFFYAFALGFPTFTFIVLFVGALLFSLFTFLSLKTKTTPTTVPLAGLMSIFLLLMMLAVLIFKTPSLYTL